LPANLVVNRPSRLHFSRNAKEAENGPHMEFLRHPLYSILAVIVIGAVSGLLAQVVFYKTPKVGLPLAILAGIGAAFIGFHAAMLSNLATGVILMPFALALVVSAVASFALLRCTR
jgi:uncharacterized membrane protein YeaQ/YmgE (transglycosylase-associated protein family)